MSLFEDLYTQVILEHYKTPHNYGVLPNATVEARGYNESCGDDIRVGIRLEHDTISEVRFSGKGCAISQASASMMTDYLQGKTVHDALKEIEEFKMRMTGTKDFPESDDYAELSALQGVLKFPIRVKCATLAWNTMRNGLLQQLTTPNPVHAKD